MRMKDLWIFSLTVFAGFFAISLTEQANSSSRKRVAKISTITAFIIICCFTIAGKYIFDFFGLTTPAFKIFGGLLVAHVGFEMLMSRQPRTHD
jgi:multiple antibiotic resistance protein